MARYTDIDKLIAEYDRVHVGPAGGARKLMVEAPIADVAPRAEVAREIFEEIEAILEYWYSATANTYDGTILTHITDLKKKYTQTEGEV